MKYCDNLFPQTKDCYDVSAFGESMDMCYEMSGAGGAKGKSQISNSCFCLYTFYGGYNLFYSMNCSENSKNLFGCTDLRGKQYCILNKQYTKEEYEVLVPKIIEHMRTTGEWGEFFPLHLSAYGYNESLAMEVYPKMKEEALALHGNWSDYEVPFVEANNTILAKDLPDHLKDTSEALLNSAISCMETGKLFKYTPQELLFYKKQGLPLPRLHPEVRHLKRLAKRNPEKIYDRHCMKCTALMKTSYGPERSEIVYCESCYQKEVY